MEAMVVGISKLSQQKRLVYGLSLASILVYINLYLMQGMLPLLAERFDISTGASSLVLSVSSFSLALSLLLFATLSDAIGRYLPLVCALWLLAFSNPLMLMIDSFDDLLGLRLLQGILLAAVPAIAMAMLREHLSLPEVIKAAAFYIAANSIGGIVGRLLGGMMAENLSWDGAILTLSALTLVGVVLCHGLLAANQDKAANKHIEPRPWQGFLQHLGRAELRLFYLLGGLAFMVMVNQFSFIQLHLLQAPFEWSRFEVTLIFLCYLSGTFSAYRSGSAVRRLGVIKLLALSLLLMLVGSLVTLQNSALAIVTGFLLSACGFFLIHSCCNSQVALRVSTHRAKASSLYLCSYYLGAALGGPFLMPFWSEAGWQGVVAGSVLLLLVAAVVVFKLRVCLAKNGTAGQGFTALEEDTSNSGAPTFGAANSTGPR